MAKGKTKSTGNKNDIQFIRTAANLKRKGKTNKKLKSNPNAMKHN